MWLLYEIFYIIGLLVYLPGALRRKRLPHAQWSMRLGRYPEAVSQALQGRSSSWLHAVSVGEVLAAKPLIRALEDCSNPLVVSTITPSGQEVLRTRVARSAQTIYFPLDLRCCVRKALDTFQPKILILMESELWPLMVAQAAARGIPVVVVNGRVSPRSHKRYLAMRWWLKRVLNSVSGYLMQSELDAQRLMDAGVEASKIRVTGNLKWDASLSEPPSVEDIAQIRNQLNLDGSAFLWVAGSTHRGEEELLLDAYKACVKNKQIKLVIAVRHLERLAEVEALVHKKGLRVARPSAGEADWQVWLVDTFGQLPKYYALADLVTLGGSFIPHGGQNPLEAAALGKPVLFGPHMFNFPQISQTLLDAQAAIRIERNEDLKDKLTQCIEDVPTLRRQGKNALECVQRHTGATQQVLEALRSYADLGS